MLKSFEKMSLCAAGLGLFVAISAHAHDPGYVISEILPLPGHVASSGVGMNRLGDVVGWSEDADGNRHPFVWRDGTTEALPVPANVISAEALDLNDQKWIVGTALFDDQSVHAVAWNNEVFIDLSSMSALGDANTSRTNEAGISVGGAFINALNAERAMAWDAKGTPSIVGTLAGDSAALGINELNDIVGWSNDSSGVKHAFLYQHDTSQMVDLGLLPEGLWTVATSINEDGVVVGYGETEGEESGVYGFKWDPQTQQMEELGTLGSDDARANDISAANFIVGTSVLGGTGDPTAALWRPDRLVNLNALLLPGSPWDWLEEANAITDEGQIVGQGLISGNRHGFLLEPVLGLADPIPGRAGVRNTFDAAGATPGNMVVMVYGFDWGDTGIPGCPGARLNIKKPKIMAKKRADQIGHAIVDLPVPKSAKGMAVIFQAVEPATCEVSSPVAWVFF